MLEPQTIKTKQPVSYVAVRGARRRRRRRRRAEPAASSRVVRDSMSVLPQSHVPCIVA